MIVRLARSDDAAAIAAIYRPYVESTVITFEVEPPDEAGMRERIEHTLPRHPWLVAEIDRQVAGYAYASAHRSRPGYQWSVDVSAYLDPQWQRQGIARRLYTSLLSLLVSQGYCTAYAGIALPNPASVGLHESVGFRPFVVYHQVGFKLGTWVDVGWWSRPLAPQTPDPAPPRDLTHIDVDGIVT